MNQFLTPLGRGNQNAAAAGGGAPALVLPSGAILELDARRDITIVGSGVDTWTDQSGSGFDAVQTVDLDRPSLVASLPSLNEQPVVRFDASNTEWMDLSGLSEASTDWSIYMVIDLATLTGVQRIIDFETGRQLIDVSDGVGGWRTYDGTYRALGAAQTGAQSLCVVGDGSLQDGYRGGTSTASLARLQRALGGTRVHLGRASTTNTAHLDADLAFLAIYPKAHDAAERAAVFAYTAQEWGV